jgi:hypothetical protein
VQRGEVKPKMEAFYCKVEVKAKTMQVAIPAGICRRKL